MTASICAHYKSIDGWHIFQSNELPGLYVASRDAKKAYDDVALSIKTLVMLDEGVDCDVVPEKSFHEFVASVKQHASDGAEHAPVVMSSRRYLLTSLAA